MQIVLRIDSDVGVGARGRSKVVTFFPNAYGKSIYTGDVSFNNAEDKYASIFERIWAILEKDSNGDFEAIEDRKSVV